MKKLVVTILAAAALSSIGTVTGTAQQGAAAVANLNMAEAPTLNVEGIRKVQRKLREKGIDPGPFDGVAGPRTTEAVRAFQQRFGMKASGVIDNQLLFALGEAELALSPAR